MANIIKSHNQKILNKNNEASNEKKCNCGNKSLCPLDGVCLTKNIIYEATVTTTSGNKRTYIGMTEHEFKTRYNNHKLSFKDRKHSHNTVLSKYIWDLKDGNIDYIINWRIIKRASAYKGNPSCCNQCIAEKLCILRNLSWYRNAATKTSFSWQPIGRCVSQTAPKFITDIFS